MKPTYNHSIISTIMSILNYYGDTPNYQTNKKIDEYLKIKPRNVILLVLDGMGYDFLKKYFPSSSLFTHTIDKVTSTFPPTTTAAIKSYMSGLTPLEHGWLGWCPYFEKENMHIELLPYKDASTGQRPLLSYDIRDDLQFTTIFERIHRVNKNIDLHTNEHSYIKEEISYANNHSYDTLEEMFDNLEKIISNGKHNFIYCYHDNPDALMHEHGPSSPVVQKQFKKIISYIDKFIEKNINSDSLLIISADHGQIDVEKYIDVQEDKILMNMIKTYPSIEPRFTSFILKEKEQSKEFEKHFLKNYGSDFFLFNKDEFLKSGYLGKGNIQKEVSYLLGDYVALGKSKAMFINGKSEFVMKGHHAGTLHEEMVVPIIMFALKHNSIYNDVGDLK